MANFQILSPGTSPLRWANGGLRAIWFTGNCESSCGANTLSEGISAPAVSRRPHQLQVQIALTLKTGTVPFWYLSNLFLFFFFLFFFRKTPEFPVLQSVNEFGSWCGERSPSCKSLLWDYNMIYTSFEYAWPQKAIKRISLFLPALLGGSPFVARCLLIPQQFALTKPFRDSWILVRSGSRDASLWLTQQRDVCEAEEKLNPGLNHYIIWAFEFSLRLSHQFWDTLSCSASTQASHSSCRSLTGRMWNVDRVEDSPQSGEEEKPGGWGGGVDSFQVCITVGRKGVTFLFVGGGCRQGRSGSSGVIPSSHRIHSCWGRAGWEGEGTGKTLLPWCTLLKHAGLWGWSWMRTMRRIHWWITAAWLCSTGEWNNENSAVWMCQCCRPNGSSLISANERTLGLRPSFLNPH